MAEDTITTPWWAAPASGAVVKPQPGQAYASTAVGAFGCDVRSESAARQGWRGARPALGSTASAPSIVADAAALRAAIVAAPCTCVNITASWCQPCVRFHPKFVGLSASFPNVAFVSVDINHLDNETLETLGVETVPTILLMRGGIEVTRIVGVAHKRPAKPLAAAIRRHLGDA